MLFMIVHHKFVNMLLLLFINIYYLEYIWYVIINYLNTLYIIQYIIQIIYLIYFTIINKCQSIYGYLILNFHRNSTLMVNHFKLNNYMYFLILIVYINYIYLIRKFIIHLLYLNLIMQQLYYFLNWCNTNKII